VGKVDERFREAGGRRGEGGPSELEKMVAASSPELEKMAAVGEGKRAAAAGTRVRQSCGELGPARGGAVAGGGGEGVGVGEESCCCFFGE